MKTRPIRCLLVWMLGLAFLLSASVSAAQATPQTPQITSVSFNGSGKNLQIIVQGSVFGPPQYELPYTGDVSNFEFHDISKGWYAGHAGLSDDDVTINYNSWSDTEIVVKGFSGSYGGSWTVSPGDSVRISVWNTSTGQESSWTGTLPQSAAPQPPQFTSISFNGSGQNLQIIVQGSAFGPPQYELPYTGDVDNFKFTDISKGWHAGYDGDDITLNYGSWSDTEIVINGFSGSYGKDSWAVSVGDSVAISVRNSSTGQESLWNGTLPQPAQPALQSLTITPNSSLLNAGQTAQLSVSANYSDGSNQNVTNSASWSSSNTAAVTISNGLATPVAPGLSTITASWNGLTATATVQVQAPQTTVQSTTVVFTIGSQAYTLNGQPETMDAAPFVNSNDRTMVPVRFLAQSLGALVNWDANSQTVTLTEDGTTEVMVVGSTALTVNGSVQTMDTAPVIVPPGRTELPARFVAQAFGYTVTWNGSAGTVTITNVSP